MVTLNILKIFIFQPNTDSKLEGSILALFIDMFCFFVFPNLQGFTWAVFQTVT